MIGVCPYLKVRTSARVREGQFLDALLVEFGQDVTAWKEKEDAARL
jgi:hypothetical protein